MREGRFDVVHTHNPKPGVMGRIAARRAGVPVVVNTVHGLYAKPEDWSRKAIVNVGCSGKFSSDRTILEYANDIWHATPCPVA